MSILDDDGIAATIADALTSADLPLDVVLSRTVTVPNPEEPWNPGTTTTTDYACRGWADRYEAAELANTTILATDTKVMIVAGTLAVDPQPQDIVTVGGKGYTIIAVSTDPAGAMWTVQARG